MAKQYVQTEIKESPYPKEKKGPDFSSYQKISEGVYTPRTMKDQAFPRKIIAQELVGPTMNTVSGQIYKALNFTQPVTFGND